MQRRRFSSGVLAGLASAGLPAGPAFAQARAAGPDGFPKQPIRVIVPYPAGGVVDVFVRLVTTPLSEELPQRIVVESRTGADGRVGVTAAAQAPADGYTLLAVTPLVSVGEHLMPDMAGRSREFVGLCGIASSPSVWVCWSRLGPSTLAELVAMMKARPGELNLASPGSGSSLHLSQELLLDITGAQAQTITYRGQPPSLIDMADGRVHVGLISQNLAQPFIAQGKLKALAVNASKRTRALPEVPTVLEAGFPDALVQSWYGIGTRAATPAPVAAWLSDQFAQTMAQPAVRARLLELDAEILAYDGPKMTAFMAQEHRRWGELIRKRNIKAAS